MTEKEEVGLIGQIQRLSRRLSGTILSPDVRDVKAYLNRNRKKNIFSFNNENQMQIGGIVLKELAEEYGTPLYIYDANRLEDNYHLHMGSVKNSKNFMLCYAVQVGVEFQLILVNSILTQVNPNLTLLNLFNKLGSSFDVVSGGEISRCLAAGVAPAKIFFSGCGKSIEEIDLAVKLDIKCINVESWEELDRVQKVANKHNKVQGISIRVNPDIDGNKLGVPISGVIEIFRRAKASANLKIKGISCHLGSNVNQLALLIEARDKLLHLADELRQESRIFVEHFNLGGGFAAQIDSNSELLEQSDITQFIESLARPIIERGLKFVLQPYSSLVSDAGVLLSKVEYIKSPPKTLSGNTSPRSGSFIGENPLVDAKNVSTNTIAIVDAGLYNFDGTALNGPKPNIIVPVQLKYKQVAGSTVEYKYDVIGPIYETTSIIYKDMVLNQKLEIGDYVIIAESGAYGSSMSGNYNARNKEAEVIIVDGHPAVIREREEYHDQYSKEKIIYDLKYKTLNILEEEESLEDFAHNMSQQILSTTFVQ